MKSRLEINLDTVNCPITEIEEHQIARRITEIFRQHNIIVEEILFK